jgi:hypothetical protein
MKICSNPNCLFAGIPQPLEQYRDDIRYRGGYRHQCKTCERISLQERRQTQKGREAYRQHARNWRKTPQGKIATKKTYQNTQPNVRRARSYLNKQVFRGKFPKVSEQECCKCGKQATQYHHHKGYERNAWLDVVPVCAACHKKLHLI